MSELFDKQVNAQKGEKLPGLTAASVIPRKKYAMKMKVEEKTTAPKIFLMEGRSL